MPASAGGPSVCQGRLAAPKIERIARASSAGRRKLRLTGGEPLLRAELCDIVASGAIGVETLH
jgi:molybdenum cofactor biosynthesis enzyme MoaA